MLEILLVIYLARRIAAIVRSKGRAPAGYVTLFVVLWIGGEFAGAIFGAILTAGQGGFTIYISALLGAATGAALSFILANGLEPIGLPNARSSMRFQEDDEYRRRYLDTLRAQGEWERVQDQVRPTDPR